MTLASAQQRPALSAQQRDWVGRARAQLDRDELAELLLAMTAIASPTGEERPLAEWLVARLAESGIEARLQPVAGSQANAVGRLRGSGDGPALLLYAPIDTPFTTDPEEDRPWLGASPRPDFALPPRLGDGKVIGLGAENPKGFAAAIIAAVAAVARAGVPLRGDVWLALASGSMPIDTRPGIDRANLGHGSGITLLLERMVHPDFAVVVKPGYAVAHEEVGLAWFEIVVSGANNYTGIRHKGPYRNPILAAAALATELEEWFAEYARDNASGLVEPQGSINAIQAGSPDRAAFVPATCHLHLDLRVSPRTSITDVRRQLEQAVARIAERHPEFELQVQMRAALPGTATDPSSWIVRSLVAAWEEREGREHTPPQRTSGASDAAVIRGHGIPTARIGPPPPATPSPYEGFTMGVADVAALHGLAELLVGAIIDTATRSRGEVGLA